MATKAIAEAASSLDMTTTSSSDFVTRKEFEEMSERHRKLEEIVYEQNEHLQSVATEILVHRDFLQKRFGEYKIDNKVFLDR